jgi:hypothetical protein
MLLSLLWCAQLVATHPAVRAVCSPDNDLFGLIDESQVLKLRYESVAAALAALVSGDVLLVLATDYPNQLTPITPAQYMATQQRGAKVFVEFPASLPPNSSLNATNARIGAVPVRIDAACGVTSGGNEGTISRLVTVGQVGALEPLRIMSAHGAVVLPLQLPLQTATAAVPSCVHVMGARVAGYDTAVFGLPTDPNASTIVLFSATADVLISTTHLSNLITARYGPLVAYTALLRFMFTKLGLPTTALKPLVASVRPHYSPDEMLPTNSQAAAVEAAVHHLAVTSGLLYSGRDYMDSGSTSDVATLVRRCPVSAAYNDTHQHNTTCIDEGFGSNIDFLGRQSGESGDCPACGCLVKGQCANTRTDDNAQSAIGFAVAGWVLNDTRYSNIAAAIVEYGEW